MNRFQANGPFDLLRNREFQAAIRRRTEELLREREKEMKKAGYWERRAIVEAIQQQVKAEFAKEHCLF
jgi:hypothetical protein